MLPIIKYKIILFTITVTSLCICTLILCFGILDIYADLRTQMFHHNNATIDYTSHKVVSLSIFSFCNMSTFLHICYMAIHALRGLRTNWVMGCHYFLYCVSELISACVIFTEFHRLNYANALAFLVATLAVCLFFITFAAEKIFVEVEGILGTEIENSMYHKVYKRLVKKSRKKKPQCVRIELVPSYSNIAGPSSPSKQTYV